MFFSLKNTETSYALLAAASGLRKYLAACLLAASVTQCFAQTDFTWGNASGGDWFTAGNWAEAGGPPGNLDSATIDLVTGVPYRVSVGSNFTIGSVSLDSADAKLFLANSAASLTTDNFNFDEGATLDVSSGGTISSSQDAISKIWNLASGTILGNPDFLLHGDSTVNIGGATDLIGDWSLLLNHSSGTSQITALDNKLSAGRGIYQLKGGTTNILSPVFTNDGTISLVSSLDSPTLNIIDGAGYGRLINAGLLEVKRNTPFYYETSSKYLNFELDNLSTGVVDIDVFDHPVNSSGVRTYLGSATGSADHKNQGIFSVRGSDTNLVVQGNSFENTGAMSIGGHGANFAGLSSFIHSAGVISIEQYGLLTVANLSVTGGATLDATNSLVLPAFGYRKNLLVDAGASTAVVEFSNGTALGNPQIFVKSDAQVNVGLSSEFSGDLTFFLQKEDGTTSFNFADHELSAGRSIFHENSGDIEIVSNTFTNNSIIESELEYGKESEFRITNGSGTGTLINNNQITIKRIVGQTSGNRRLNFELLNSATGQLNLEFGTGHTTLGGVSRLENHVNQGTVNISGGSNLTVEGDTFTNDGDFNADVGQLIINANSFTNNGTFSSGGQVRGNRFVNNGTVDGGASNGLAFVGPISITGAGSFAGNIIFSGRYSPGNSPAIVHFENLKLINGSVLETEIGGLTAGTEHDQLIVSGTTELDGRLEIPIINGFQPAVGDVVTIISANSVTGSFKQAFSANLPDNRAIEVAINATDVTLTFKLPDAEGYDPATGGGSWLNSSIWLSGVIPDTLDNTTIINNTSTSNQTVSVNTDAFSNNLDVSSTNGTMTVQVPASRSLSAINSVDIDMNGVVDLTGGTLLSGNIDVNNGGELTGAGTLVGNVNVGSDGNGESLFKPGTTIGDNVSIEGNYRQESDGTMEIEVDGTGVGEFDTITVDGNAAFGGKLTVVINDPSAIAAGDVIEVVTAGSLTPDAIFEEIEAIGLAPGLYLAPLYDGVASANAELAASSTGGGRFSIAGFPVGDMNLSGGIDASDIALFALALIDKDEYESMFGPIAVSAGNADGLGGLDFDDIDDFSALISGGSAVQVHAAIQALLTVPEPHSITLAMFVALTCTTRRSRFAPR